MASKNKKIATAVTAVTLAVTLAVGGTFAWQSISQEATNIVSDAVNPGGRLHNDFDGEAELNVYAENFGNQNIYARVQLSEYLEVGEAAGNAADPDREVNVLIGGSKENIHTYDQYEVYKYDAENTSDEYWEKSWGGSTLYIPTFNMNQDSLEPDLNGTYGYVNPDTQEKDPYGDFVDINETYHVDDPVTGSEVVDADTNDDDEGTNAAEGTNITTTADQIHNVAQSLTAEVISMSYWLNNYYDYETETASDFTGWVYDEDGWAYWSQPIEPGTATGLLYDGISDLGYIDDDYFYDIHVKGQFITKGDIGSDDGTGFYDTAAGPEPTAEALMLLKAIGVKTDGNTGEGEGQYSNFMLLSNDEEANAVSGGEFLIFDAQVYDEEGNNIAGTDAVTFGVTENTGASAYTMRSGETSSMIDNNLFVASDVLERGVSSLTVTAEYTDDKGTVETEDDVLYTQSYDLEVQPSSDPLDITLEINGREADYLPGATDPVYQLTSVDHSASTYQFSATFNEVASNDIEWSISDGWNCTIGEPDGYGWIYAYAAAADENTSADWAALGEGTEVARLNASTGAFEVLISAENCPDSLTFYVTATTTDGLYSKTDILFMRNVDILFTMYDTSGTEANKTSVYTAGEGTEITVAANVETTEGKVSLTNAELPEDAWTLYSAEAMNPRGEAIDPANYTITYNENDMTWTLAIGESITDEYLGLEAKYDNEGVTISAFISIVEEEIAALAPVVTISDNEGQQDGAYDKGDYAKFNLNASVMQSGRPVASGDIIWNVYDSEGGLLDASIAKVVRNKNNHFTAQLWIMGADVDTIKVYALYFPEGASSHTAEDVYTVTAN